VVTVASQAGPRILTYSRVGRPSLFADLPDATIEHPAIGRYHFLGGHRLWRAPEEPAVTYHPDEHGARATVTDDSFELAGAPDRDGVTKRIVVRQAGEITLVDHVLHNGGRTPVLAAPWAITQLAPGGTAVLPQPVGDPASRLPDRHLVLWPYTDLGDPQVCFVGDTIRVDDSTTSAEFKVGFANRRGWLAYHRGDQLFVKWGPVHDDDQAHADLGCTAECYRNELFLELETLGPLTTISPGEGVRHREAWTLVDVDATALDDVLAALPACPPEMTT
jgi:hypothetical protein